MAVERLQTDKPNTTTDQETGQHIHNWVKKHNDEAHQSFKTQHFVFCTHSNLAEREFVWRNATSY
jgi:secreted PhoX family phosphatase